MKRTVPLIMYMIIMGVRIPWMMIQMTCIMSMMILSMA